MTSVNFIPATLPPHLLACADFAAEGVITQHRIALMLWRSHEPGRRHHDWPAMVTFTKEETQQVAQRAPYWRPSAAKCLI